MTGSVEDAHPTAGRLAALLIDASTEAISAAGGHAGGIYLRSRTPGLLRLAVLAGLPGPLFRPWWRLHADRPFPVADAYRLGVQVILPNATETMRRYPQFAAGLPFQFGSLYVPVVAGATTYGVLTVLRPAVTDAAEVLSGRDRVVRLAQELAEALRGLEDEDPDQVAWDGEPVCLRPPTASTSVGRVGRFAWDPETTYITLDEDLHTLLGVPPSEFAGTIEAFAEAVAPSDAHRILATLRDTAVGRPPALPLYLRDEDGELRLLDLWNACEPPAAPAVRGVVVAPGPAPTADSAADLLPEGVFCVDRLGLVVYANPRAAQLLGRPRAELVGRDLWEAVPWLARPDFEDHLRAALLTPDPVHFHLVRPPGGEPQTGSTVRGPELLEPEPRPPERDSSAEPSVRGPGAGPTAGKPGAGSTVPEPETGSPARDTSAEPGAEEPGPGRAPAPREPERDAGARPTAAEPGPGPTAQEARQPQSVHDAGTTPTAGEPGPGWTAQDARQPQSVQGAGTKPTTGEPGAGPTAQEARQPQSVHDAGTTPTTGEPGPGPTAQGPQAPHSVHHTGTTPTTGEPGPGPTAQGPQAPHSVHHTGTTPTAKGSESPLPTRDAGSPSRAHGTGSPPPAQDTGPPPPADHPGSPRPAPDPGPPPPATPHIAPTQDTSASPQPYEGDWLALSVHSGPDRLTCTVRPASRVPDSPAGQEMSEGGVSPLAPLYRPIALAIALTEASTARQVSAVVMRELLPAFGGRRLAIYLLQERHLYLEWEAGFPKGFLAPFEGVDLGARLPGVETLTTGRPLFFDSMEQLTAAYPGIPLDAAEGARAFLPLIASGRPVGSCILGFDRPRSFSTEERTVLTALAGLIAHAMEKAQRYESETVLARGLQQALLPRRLAAHPLLETTGRYLPGTAGMEVGGDWYDVVESGDGLALVIGDVQGHGVQAAATMGQLRTAVRAFALGDRPPDEVLSSTNHLLIDLDPGLFASCCYIRLDPATGVARAARAGHPPPLLRSPDGRTRVLDLPGGVVLGVAPRARYPVTELRMEPGAILALYTDGLVEKPGSDIDQGITALRVALAKAGAPAARPGSRFLAGVADRLTATARHALDRPDDIALLLATRRATPTRSP
ncbi:serine phosphatase RsbU (regulator of sigma subunit)/PAS domain-containing protein [Streptomyces sp. SAI-117]|uniref:SpoIIE family protein phosphatase n=1 Tax=Streptomyces sp. SAI-117 TaxID=2940546 RepID=UPI0024758E2F|nr:SpoIIE family protein phosphatase [Streptomyces sp. SAI-117]MDH6565772.1 serine phosphatase RsbU (regulator of sigma subunit)/PAS domain-containing protein [Streptomyces sp. SAI-117]